MKKKKNDIRTGLLQSDVHDTFRPPEIEQLENLAKLHGEKVLLLTFCFLPRQIKGGQTQLCP